MGRWTSYTAAERVEIWRQWKAGYSTRDIGRALGRKFGSIYMLLAPCGGIRPRERKRAPRTLTLAEREEISRGLASDASIRQIAERLRRAPSTVSREVRRHGGRRAYRAGAADRRAWRWALRPKACVLRLNGQLQGLVAGKLQLDWSPQQISGWLKRSIPPMRACECRPRRYTAPCSCKRAAR